MPITQKVKDTITALEKDKTPDEILSLLSQSKSNPDIAQKIVSLQGQYQPEEILQFIKTAKTEAMPPAVAPVASVPVVKAPAPFVPPDINWNPNANQPQIKTEPLTPPALTKIQPAEEKQTAAQLAAIQEPIQEFTVKSAAPIASLFNAITAPIGMASSETKKALWKQVGEDLSQFPVEDWQNLANIGLAAAGGIQGVRSILQNIQYNKALNKEIAYENLRKAVADRLIKEGAESGQAFKIADIGLEKVIAETPGGFNVAGAKDFKAAAKAVEKGASFVKPGSAPVEPAPVTPAEPPVAAAPKELPAKVPGITQPHEVVAIDAQSGKPIVKMGEPAPNAMGTPKPIKTEPITPAPSPTPQDTTISPKTADVRPIARYAKDIADIKGLLAQGAASATNPVTGDLRGYPGFATGIGNTTKAELLKIIDKFESGKELTRSQEMKLRSAIDSRRSFNLAGTEQARAAQIEERAARDKFFAGVDEIAGEPGQTTIPGMPPAEAPATKITRDLKTPLKAQADQVPQENTLEGLQTIQETPALPGTEQGKKIDTELYHGGKGGGYGGTTYFSSDKQFAQEFGKVKKQKVSVSNAYVFPSEGYKTQDGKLALDKDGEPITIGWLEDHPEIVADLQKRGFDGAVDGNNEFVVKFSSVIPRTPTMIEPDLPLPEKAAMQKELLTQAAIPKDQLGDYILANGGKISLYASQVARKELTMPEAIKNIQNDYAKAIVEKAGGKYTGIQQGLPADAENPALPDLVMFDDSRGSTLALPMEQMSEQAVKDRLAQSDITFRELQKPVRGKIPRTAKRSSIIAPKNTIENPLQTRLKEIQAKIDEFNRTGNGIKALDLSIEANKIKKQLSRPPRGASIDMPQAEPPKAEEYKPIEIPGLSRESAIDTPELVDLALKLTGKYPRILKRINVFHGMARGVFRPGQGGQIDLKANLAKNPIQLSQTLAHEIGHAGDWLPDRVLGRGNILGRAASLTKYFKEMISELPDAGVEPITPKERAAIRYRITKQIYDKYGFKSREAKRINAATKKKMNEEIALKYKDAITKETSDRGMISKKVVMDELKYMSEWWKPFDTRIEGEFKKYRFSSSELYADAASVYINNNKAFKQLAPEFSKLFENYASRKPAVESTVKGLFDTALNKPKEEVNKMVIDQLKESTKAGEKKLFDLSTTPKDHEKSILWKLGYEIFTENMKMRELGAKLGLVEDNPIIFINNANYKIGGKTSNYLEDQAVDYDQALIKSNISPEEASTYAKLKTVEQSKTVVMDDEGNLIGIEPKDIIGEMGVTTQTASRYLEELKNQMGAEKFGKLEEIAGKFYANHAKLMKWADEKGWWTPEQYAIIQANPFYTRTAILEYLKSASINPAMKERVGSVKPSINPFTATMMADTKMIELVVKNEVKRQMFENAISKFPDEFMTAKRDATGKIIPKQGWGTLVYKQGGKQKAFYVDPYIPQTIENTNPQHAEAAIRLLSSGNLVVKSFVTTYSIAFQLRNIIRDLMQTVKVYPSNSFLKSSYKVVELYLKNAGIALEAGGVDKAWAKLINQPINLQRSSERLRSLRDKGVIDPSAYSLNWFDNPSQADYEHIVELFHKANLRGIDRPGKIYENIIKAATAKVFDALNLMETLSIASEALPKLIGESQLSKMQMKEEIKNYILHTQFGSPDFREGGRSKTVKAMTFMLNPAIRGTQSVYEALIKGHDKYKTYDSAGNETGEIPDPISKAGYAYKSAIFTISAWAGMLAGLGLLGSKTKQWYQKIPLRDKKNYFIPIIPIMDGDKAVYITIPLEESFLRPLNGVIVELMHDNIMKPMYLGSRYKNNIAEQVADLTLGLTDTYGSGMLSFNPAAELLFQDISYAGGINPQDRFRGRGVLGFNDEAILKAGGVVRATPEEQSIHPNQIFSSPFKTMLTYQLDKLGIPTPPFITSYKDARNTYGEGMPPSAFQSVLNAIPPLKTFVRVSNLGEIELTKEMKASRLADTAAKNIETMRQQKILQKRGSTPRSK